MAGYRNSIGEWIAMPKITASDAKNQFGKVLDRVLSEGPITITRHDTDRAVVISMAEFEKIQRKESPAIAAFDGELDEWFDSLQTPESKKAMNDAFYAMPGEPLEDALPIGQLPDGNE